MTNIKVKENICHQFGDPEISARIKALRKEKLGLDQVSFAREIGVKQAIVSQWESVKHRPSPLALMRIGDIAGSDRIWWYEQAGPEFAEKAKSEERKLLTNVFSRKPSKSIDSVLLADVMELLDREIGISKWTMPIRQIAALVAVIYEDSWEKGYCDESAVKLVARASGNWFAERK